MIHRYAEVCLIQLKLDSFKLGFKKKIVIIETVYDTEAVIEMEERRVEVRK